MNLKNKLAGKFLKIVAILFIGWSSQKVVAQNYILAGQHTSTDVFIDYNPDTAINATVNGSAAILSLDMNLDGTQDFLLHASVGSNPFGGNDNIRIIPLNQNAAAYEFADSCVNGGGTLLYTRFMAKSFPAAYYIGVAGYWMQDTVHLHYNTYSTTGTSCSNSVNIDYVGTRIISGSDTLYGWIKLTYTSFGNITVEEFACNASSLNTIPENKNVSFSISPNPAHHNLYLNFDPSLSIKEINLYSISGSLLKQFHPGDKTNYPLDVSDLNPGIYLLAIDFGSGQKLYKKLLIGE